MRSCGERFPLVLVDRNAELGGDAIEAPAQDLRIEVCRALFLDLSSGVIERHNEILSGGRNTVLIGPSAQKDHDGRLPIDKGSVHVKGYGVEIEKLQHHGFGARLLSPSAHRCAACVGAAGHARRAAKWLPYRQAA